PGNATCCRRAEVCPCTTRRRTRLRHLNRPPPPSPDKLHNASSKSGKPCNPLPAQLAMNRSESRRVREKGVLEFYLGGSPPLLQQQAAASCREVPKALEDRGTELNPIRSQHR